MKGHFVSSIPPEMGANLGRQWPLQAYDVGSSFPADEDESTEHVPPQSTATFEHNQFVMQTVGVSDSFRLASVRRENPMFRDSVFIGAGDAINPASIDGEEDA